MKLLGIEIWSDSHPLKVTTRSFRKSADLQGVGLLGLCQFDPHANWNLFRTILGCRTWVLFLLLQVSFIAGASA